MAALIDQPDKAQQLARAICSDIALYNEAALSSNEATETVKEALAEGFELYRTRTSPELHSLFIEIAETQLLANLSPQQRDLLRSTLQQAAATQILRPVPSSGSPLSLVTGIVVVVILIAALWILFGR
jgi:hypothetical protein